MTNKMKWTVAVIAALVTGVGFAGSIKVWSNGQTLTAADINANFAHLHSLMVGGHGPRLVDADVSSGAALSSAKLSQGPGIADGWGRSYLVTCSSSPCTLDNSYGVTSVTRSSAGTYVINVPGPLTFGSVCLAQPVGMSTAAPNACECDYNNSTSWNLTCSNTGSTVDMGFKFAFWSN